MARPKSPGGLTPLELEIMMILWKAGFANVEAVQASLPAERELGYTTVQTMLNVLVRKGKVTREKEGRAFIYRPAEDRKSAVRTALKDLVDRMFGGSAEELVLGLVETKQLNPSRLEALQRELRREKDKRDGRH